MNSLIKTQGKKVSDKRRTLIFLNINVSCIATSVFATALATAVPPIMDDLKVNINNVQWLNSGFFLFLSVMTPFTAFLISTIKTKLLYCSGVGIFIVGLIICAFSRHFWVMMIGRIIQSSGFGLLTSMAQVIILSIYPPNKVGVMMGWYGLSIGLAPIAAPTIAGIIVDTIGWRWIFIISTFIMGCSFIFALFIFEDVLPTMNKKFDVISLILSAITFGGITLAAAKIGTDDFLSWTVAFPLFIGLFTGIFFVYRQLHTKVPFLDIRVLKNRDYTVGIIANFIVQLIFMGAVMIIPIYVQQVKNKSATLSGLVNIPGSLALGAISPFAGKIYDKLGMKLLFLVGSTILILSNLSIYFVRIQHTVWIMGIANMFRSLAIGLLLMPLITYSMNSIAKIKTPDATALYNTVRFIGGALGSALFISIITKVAHGIGSHKENPEMFGINVVFLSMAIIGFILLLLGIFGCKQPFIRKQNKPKNESENELINDDTALELKEKKMTTTDEKTGIDIKDRDLTNSENGTPIDSSNKDLTKNKSDSGKTENISKPNSEIDVIDILIKDEK